MSIKDYLKQLRVSSNLSINSLAKLSNVSASHISRIESGSRQPTPDILRKLSNVFDAGYLELLIIADIINKNELEEYTKKELAS